MLIDSHCHLGFKDYPESELEGILMRAAEADVSFMINVGAGDGLDGNFRAVELAKKFPQIFATVGIHPHDAKIVDENVISRIESLASDPKVVAIGEVGLDFHYNHSPEKEQIEVLERFIDMAKKFDKPLMIHDRSAGDKTWEILKLRGVPPKGIMIHCFTGTPDLARKYLDLGCLLSFTGIITFKKSQELRDVVAFTPIERMLIETDAPYLAPEPHRGKRNEPAFVRLVAERVAAIKSLTFDDVARITTLTAKRFFNLPLPDLQASVAYAIRDSLYLNITNRCTLACRFCPKFIDFEVKGYYLKLAGEPSVEEVFSSMGDYARYEEIVFCGYGEPTRRLDDLLTIARRIKSTHPSLRIRVNTDGLGNLVHARNILPELASCVDALSVSLNAHNAATYAKHCPSKYKEDAYPAVKDFIREAVHHIPDVTASVVGLPDVDRAACEKIAAELGAKFRYREYNNVG